MHVIRPLFVLAALLSTTTAFAQPIKCQRGRVNAETLELKFEQGMLLSAEISKRGRTDRIVENVECRISKQNQLVFICRDVKRGIEVHSHLVRRDFMAFNSDEPEHAFSQVMKLRISQPAKGRPRQRYEYQRQYNVDRCDVTSL